VISFYCSPWIGVPTSSVWCKWRNKSSLTFG
jgi:hypothetical protein